jgi:putative membrane protein
MNYLSEEQHQLVSSAVTAAEEATSGEIVTVLAERSDSYNDVALLWAAAAAFSAMSLFAALPEPFLKLWDNVVGMLVFQGWHHDWTTGEIVSMALALGLIAFVAMLLAQRYEPLKFALVPAPTRTARVHARAIKHFKVGAERRTVGSTGVLIYLSMREHRAEIVADQSIAEKVPAEVWGEAMGDMLAEIRRGCIAEGIAAGVRDVGYILAEHFPRGDNDTNELPDRLIEV